jgi:hypothetical protein
MTIRCLLSREEVMMALVKAALEKRGIQFRAGAHAAQCTLLTVSSGENGIDQARMEIELDEEAIA